MELDKDDAKVDGVPERKNSDFVWMLTLRGKKMLPSEPPPPDEDEKSVEEDDVVKHPISRNARRRRLRELRSSSHRRPAGEQLDKLRAAIYGDWMTHDFTLESESNTQSTKDCSRPRPKARMQEKPFRILKIQRQEQPSSFVRRSPTSPSGHGTWLSRRAVLTPHMPQNPLD